MVAEVSTIVWHFLVRATSADAHGAGLTYLKGKRIVELQCSLGLLSVSDATAFLKGKDQDTHGREPFRHPAIETVECLLGGAHQYFTHHKALSNLATQYGLPEVVRWHPKNVSTVCAWSLPGAVSNFPP